MIEKENKKGDLAIWEKLKSFIPPGGTTAAEDA
jgi:hypothetical protein